MSSRRTPLEARFRRNALVLMLLLMGGAALALYLHFKGRDPGVYALPRQQLKVPPQGKVRLMALPETRGLPIWSVDTKVNRIACNRQYKAASQGWVIKQWKNQDSLCHDKDPEPARDCPGASSEWSTSTSRYCHWKAERKVLLSMNAAKMRNHGCNPNAKGNVGGFVSYLAWEPKILPDFFKQRERYMLRNMQEIFVRFRFRNLKVDDAYECDRSQVDKEAMHTKGIVHSYATATFSEIEPGTRRGTGRTIFYQILNYDARPKVQEHILQGRHVYLTCNYRNNKHSTMIYRDTVFEFGQPIAWPPRKGGGDWVDYEFNLLAGMKRGIKECYGDIDPGNFKFTGFHIGTEIKNGAYHEFMIGKPEIEIIYSRDPG
ncbi:hypothetical protein [Thiolapillus brandeum]|uniref:Uncharacterized protein n=1 Tax=Thiolapillus brandeum TaxID=1076588 RepID=A0A7U6GIW4_9GAMM|nr:hypothetical protein [Thiolapillus brandeum]BAO44508.1 hypothetical protein TBH_C1591 [Thiolapillus brandeum]